MVKHASTSANSTDQRTLELDCGIAPARIVAWLEDELEFVPSEDGAYLFESAGGTCVVTVVPLGKSGRGHFALERTQLNVSGSEGSVEAFKRLFTFRFLSAGG